ncbi:PRC-barrel domain-containing protein [Candidatus Gracilibacteria bacterium]|nr:PRC-barrel domain-containing protein [Candidatus Gracilibacteria bacterium]
MLTSFRSAQQTWVFTKNNKDIPVGGVVDFVVDPDSGIFAAIWVKVMDGLKLLSPQDIIRWDEQQIVIPDENDLSNPENFLRIQKIIEKEVPIIGSPVFVKEEKIGKVYDFAFDTISPRILTLLVRSGWFLFGTERIIPQNRIIKISKKGIFISDNEIKTAEKLNLENEVVVPSGR